MELSKVGYDTRTQIEEPKKELERQKDLILNLEAHLKAIKKRETNCVIERSTSVIADQLGRFWRAEAARDKLSPSPGKEKHVSCP